MSAPGTNTAYLDYVTPAGVAVLTLDHFPVNSLSANVVNALAASIARVRASIEATR
jgi:hypothetical protein